MSEVKTQKTWHEVDIVGNWELSYKVRNSQGPSAFGGYHLPVYPNPFTGQKTFLKNVDGQALNGYMIDALLKTYKPENNLNEKHLISWLICHPEVKLSGVKKIDKQILEKKVSSKITLKWKDASVMDKLDEEYYQDKVVGQISQDSNKGGLSLAKLRHVLSYLDLPYRDPRFEDNFSAEKKSLRSRLSSYIRGSYENAKNAGAALDNMNGAKTSFLFKEMVRLRVIEMKHGIYTFNNTPLGPNQSAVTVFFDNHPEVYNEILSQLEK